MSQNNRRVVRGVSVALIVSFMAADLSLAAANPSPSTLSFAPPMEVLAQNPTRFEAPLDFCALKEIHQGNNDKPLIIHIQDAHSNLSGQQNLASTLDDIMSKYQVSLVLVEGGVGDGTLTPLREGIPATTRQRLAKSLLMEGQIAGEEYLNLTSNHPMKIVGVEDINLYAKSIKSYAALADKRESILRYLKTIQKSLDKLKIKFYPQELLAYEKAGQADDKKLEINFKELLELAKIKRVDFKKYPAIEKLAALQEKEKTIDFTAANLEQAALIDEIRQRGGGEDFDGNLKKLGQMKSSKAAQFSFFQKTFDIAQEKNISLKKYSHLILYGEHLKQFSALDLEAVVNELSRAEDQVYLAWLPKEEARLVRAIDRYIGLLNTAYNIQMSTEDFKLFETNEPDFSTVSYLAIINRKLAELGYFADMISYKNILEEGKKALISFYDSVDKRDLAFMENGEKVLKEEKQKVAILIAGGYHTPHLSALARQRGYSWAILTPNVTAETNQKKYEKLLLAPLGKEVKTVEVVNGESKKNGASLLGNDLLFAKKKDDARKSFLMFNPAVLMNLTNALPNPAGGASLVVRAKQNEKAFKAALNEVEVVPTQAAARLSGPEARIQSPDGARMATVEIKGPKGPIQLNVSDSAKNVMRRFQTTDSSEVITQRITQYARKPREKYSMNFFLREGNQSLLFWSLENAFGLSVPSMGSLSKYHRSQIAEYFLQFIFDDSVEEDMQVSVDDQLDIWWYLVVQLLIIRNMNPGNEEAFKWVDDLLKGLLFKLDLIMNNGQLGEKTPKDFFEERLMKLASEQSILRPEVAMLLKHLTAWTEEGEDVFYSSMSGEDEISGEPDLLQDVQRQAHLTGLLNQLRSVLRPNTESQKTAWEYPLKAIETRLQESPANTVFMRARHYAPQEEIKTTKKGMPSLWRFRLAFLERMADLGYKKWMFTESWPYLSAIHEAIYLKNASFAPQRLLELLNEYLISSKELDLMEYLGIPKDGDLEPVANSLAFWRKVKEIRIRSDVEIIAFHQADHKELPSHVVRWIDETASSKRLFIGSTLSALTAVDNTFEIQHLAGRTDYDSDTFYPITAIAHIANVIAGDDAGSGEDSSVGIPVTDNKPLLDFLKSDLGGDIALSTAIADLKRETNFIVVTPSGDSDGEESLPDPEWVDDVAPIPQNLVPAGARMAMYPTDEEVKEILNNSRKKNSNVLITRTSTSGKRVTRTIMDLSSFVGDDIASIKVALGVIHPGQKEIVSIETIPTRSQALDILKSFLDNQTSVAIELLDIHKGTTINIVGLLTSVKYKLWRNVIMLQFEGRKKNSITNIFVDHTAILSIKESVESGARFATVGSQNRFELIYGVDLTNNQMRIVEDLERLIGSVPVALVVRAFVANQDNMDKVPFNFDAILENDSVKGNAIIKVESADKEALIRFFVVGDDGDETLVGIIRLTADALEAARQANLKAREAITAEAVKQEASPVLVAFGEIVRDMRSFKAIPANAGTARKNITLVIPDSADMTPEIRKAIEEMYNALQGAFHNTITLVFQEPGEVLPTEGIIAVACHPDATLVGKITGHTFLPTPVAQKTSNGQVRLADYFRLFLLADILAGISEDEKQALLNSDKFTQLLLNALGSQGKTWLKTGDSSDPVSRRAQAVTALSQASATPEFLKLYQNELLIQLLDRLNLDQLIELAGMIRRSVEASA